MKKYNYYEAVKNDVMEWMEDAWHFNIEEYDSLEELEEYLNDTLWTEDSVTGNASGSYTFNSQEAEEYLLYNLDLLGEALDCFGCDVNVLEKGPEWCDVTIRCYLLSQAISEVLEDIREDFEAMLEAKESEDNNND